MTTEQDVQIARWFNAAVGDSRRPQFFTMAELNQQIRRALRVHGIKNDGAFDQVSHVRNLLQDTGQAQPILQGARASRGFKVVHVNNW